MNESIDQFGRGQFGCFGGREIPDAFKGEKSQKKENGSGDGFVEARSRSGGSVEERKVAGTKRSRIGVGSAVGAGVSVSVGTGEGEAGRRGENH